MMKSWTSAHGGACGRVSGLPYMIRDFFLGFIKIHILHHASRAPVYGLALIEELRRHGYDVSAGTLYPVLHALEDDEYSSERNVSSVAKCASTMPLRRRGAAPSWRRGARSGSWSTRLGRQGPGDLA